MARHELDVLLTEAQPGDCDGVADRLSASGHRVHRCHRRADADADPGKAGEAGEAEKAGDARCVAWEPGGRCPLTAGPIDLVVDARTGHGPETPREQGALCALLANVPLVVCGPTDTRNSLLLRADVVCRPERLALACHAAMSPVGPAAHRAVARAVRTALADSGRRSPEICVHLELRDHTVVADITVAAPPSATTYPRVRSAARIALAAFTDSWPYAPVTVYHGTVAGA
ncbi:hypothetical protein [Yinghuangia seranimata]|uniref:hypothetical protein n=1 Tax=Yinghuangia seranimata TaxID=408067 RepID=UPI00248CECD2|nr:hypothetical protein [Yinghuangia seranimata]MDI2125455.1 hypothetical protein [Yinghuangia seranimata]